MGGAVAPLRENEIFVNMLNMFSNHLAGILAVIIFKEVMQSASA